MPTVDSLFAALESLTRNAPRTGPGFGSRADPERKASGTRPGGDASWPILPSPFEVLADEVHPDQQDERDRRQDQAGGVGPLGVEALDAFLDVERGRLGVADDVARDDEHRAELAERPGDGRA